MHALSPRSTGDAPSVRAVEVRALRTRGELEACVALQQEIWGPDFSDAVPPTILQVAQRVGGVAAGAFDPDGRLLGFVFGLTGVECGRIVHWSDMLAVRPEARDLGLGRRLKAFQRDAVRAAGGTVIYWTFDPLVARNAHLNLVVLGARVDEYVEDMYGDTGSPLHRLGTDRLVAAWQLDVPPSPAPAAAAVRLDEIPALNGDPECGAPHALLPRGEVPPRVRIVVPGDIAAVQTRSIEAAAAWRSVTREAFHWARTRGYIVVTFLGRPGDAYGSYLLARP